ncbi:hypothetical protein J4418_04595 [Candidatus Woesearchaeota archaeon]|nr:hypothetical protein [Candidatus Woesearchaeota archaeon]
MMSLEAIASENKMPAHYENEEKIQAERRYILDVANTLNIPLRILQHPYATKTCQEKYWLLLKTHPENSWTPKQMVKSVFADISWELYLFVFPEILEPNKKFKMGNQKTKQLTQESINYLFDRFKIPIRYSLEMSNGSVCIPNQMEYGTCTPFLSRSEMDPCREINEIYLGIKDIFIHEDQSLDDELVDVSIGGKGNEAQKLSVQLPYAGIYKILEMQYPGKVYKADFWNYEKKGETK